MHKKLYDTQSSYVEAGFYFNLLSSIIILSTSINYAILALSFEINFLHEICCVQIENALNKTFIYKSHLLQCAELFKLSIILSKLQCNLSESIIINIFNVKNKIFLINMLFKDFLWRVIKPKHSSHFLEKTFEILVPLEVSKTRKEE